MSPWMTGKGEHRERGMTPVWRRLFSWFARLLCMNSVEGKAQTRPSEWRCMAPGSSVLAYTTLITSPVEM